MSGRRVLLAWELGGNLGHLARLLAVAKELEAAGDEPVWALPANAMESPHLRHVKHRRVPVPPPVVTSDKVVPRSYAGILLNIGFANPSGVAQAVQRWKAMYASLKPDFVVLDTAPMAQLAACLFQWPAVRVSNGFDCPPAHCPTFGIGMRGPYVEHVNTRHIAQATQALQATARQAGAIRPPTLAGYLTYPRRLFDCIPETDPYGERDDVTYIGPLNALPALNEPQWPENDNRKEFNVFAYLRGCAMTQPLLQALADAKASVLCVSGGRPLDLPPGLRRRVRISDAAVNVDAAVAAADLVVSYSPLGLTTLARMYRKSQLLAPTDTEKLMLATRLEKANSGMTVLNAAAVTTALAQARALDPSPCAPLSRHGAQAFVDALNTGRESRYRVWRACEHTVTHTLGTRSSHRGNERGKG